MVGIEDIIERLKRIAPARGDRWNVEMLVADRLYLTRSENSLFSLFIEGTRESFGTLPQIGVVAHSDQVFALPGGKRLSVLRIGCDDFVNGNRVLAHIAYELAWKLEARPQPDNKSLIASIGWLLSLLGQQEPTLSPERQKGLVGECIFLRMLLLRCHELKLNIMTALNVWSGPDNAKRDFFVRGVAVEAKATANIVRLHQIGSLDQLAPHEEGEAVYLFSVGIRQDATGPKKVTHYVGDVEALLIDERGGADASALELFRRQLLSYGFDWSQRDLYERQHGFLSPHLLPALFREKDLHRLTLSDFVGSKVPETVRSISYSLEVVADPLSREECHQVLDKLLSVN